MLILIIANVFAAAAAQLPEPQRCIDTLDQHLHGEASEVEPFRERVAACRGGDCVPLADALAGETGLDAMRNLGGPKCAAALYEAACTAGKPEGCAAIGDMYLRGGNLSVDRARARHFFAAECALRGGDCDDVDRDVKENFYARHLITVSGYVGLDGETEGDRTTLPVGGELGLLRIFGDWVPASGQRGTPFGVVVAAQGEYASGHVRVGPSLAAMLWTMKLRGGYISELDGGSVVRRDARLELAMSAPWVQAPVRLVFRGDIPIGDGNARLGMFVEVGWNFALDGKRPALRDFGFPFFF